MPIAVLYALAAVVGYGLGSIPFGLLLTRAGGVGDIRAVGSGNIGATNVLRTGRKGLAAATLLLDGGKGAAAVLLMGLGGENLGLLAGFAAIAGHTMPVWLGFKGGKGVATAAGMGLALYPGTVFICVAVFTVIAVATRFVSLASVGASVALPVALLVGRVGFGHQTSGKTLVATTLLAGFIVFTHRANVSRLWKGTEPTLGR